MDELIKGTALEQARAVRDGEVSATELVEAALVEAERVQEHLGAFTLFDGDRALAAAAEVSAGDERPFAGVPYAPKDLATACEGLPLTNGSRLFGDFAPGYDSVVVARAKAAGLIVIGQTMSAELGMLPVTDTERYGSARTPFDPELTAGGSSGGAAAAVSGGALAIAGASDAGGSIRVPAACCGLVGLKPSRGRVSLAPDMGDHPLAVEGCVSRDVADTAAFLDVVAGPAPTDPVPLALPDRPFAEFAADRERRRIGLCVEPIFDGPVDPERVAAAERVGNVLAELGHEVVPIEGNPWRADEIADPFVDLFSVGVAAFAAFGEMVSGQQAGPDTLEPLTVYMVGRGRSLPAIAVAGAQQALHLWTSAVTAAIGEFDAVLSPILSEKPLEVGAIAGLMPDDQAAVAARSASRGSPPSPTSAAARRSRCRPGRDAAGLPTNVQLLGRQAEEGTLLALGAELEPALAGVARRGAGPERRTGPHLRRRRPRRRGGRDRGRPDRRSRAASRRSRRRRPRARGGSTSGGATVLPGLVDTHPHVMHFGIFAEPLVDLEDAVDHADIVARIAAKAAETPAGEWVMTTPVGEPHYFIRRSWRDLAEGRLPGREVLDRATSEHPVMIQAWAPTTPNVLALNSQGPRGARHRRRDAGAGRPGDDRAGRRRRPDRDPLRAGQQLLLQRAVRRGADGAGPAPRPGRDRARHRAVDAPLQRDGRDLRLRGPRDGLPADRRLPVAARRGEALAAGALLPGGPALRAALGHRPRRRRVRGAPRAGGGDGRALDDDLLRVDGVTIGRGGPCGPGLLLMRDPYRGPFGEETTGVSFVAEERAEAAMRFAHERGLRLNIVTAGTAEHDAYFDALEPLATEAPLAADGRAWLLQHLYFFEPEHARRAAALGLDVTTSMSFSWGKGELARERIGEDMLEHLIPLRRLLDAGLRVGCGTDWGPKNVFEQIGLAVEPTYAGSGAAAPTPGVGREEALAMWTREAAHVLRWEGVGTLEPGNHADLCVVDRDPLECPVEELAGTEVMATLLGGEPVHGSL